MGPRFVVYPLSGGARTWQVEAPRFHARSSLLGVCWAASLAPATPVSETWRLQRHQMDSLRTNRAYPLLLQKQQRAEKDDFGPL